MLLGSGAFIGSSEPPAPPGAVILTIPFATDLAATVGSATANGSTPGASSGVLIESATDNVVAYPTITTTNWTQTGTITNAYENTPAGNPGALVVNGSGVNTGATLPGAYTFAANSQKMILSVTVKNVDTAAWQINLIKPDGLQNKYRISSYLRT